MRFAIDAPDPRATNPDPVLLKQDKRARRCFDALVSGRIGSVAELASLEGISDRCEAACRHPARSGSSQLSSVNEKFSKHSTRRCFDNIDLRPLPGDRTASGPPRKLRLG
jgi:hypothetical protein